MKNMNMISTLYSGEEHNEDEHVLPINNERNNKKKSFIIFILLKKN